MAGTVLAALVLGDLLPVVAFLLLAGGVVTAFLPGVPAGLLSLAGVGLYWWGSGFTEPGVVLLVTLVVVALLSLVADWGGGLVAAKAGGAATTTTLVAGLVGVSLLVFTGPLGMLVGSVTTVFVLEYRRHQNPTAGARAAIAYVLGFFTSAFVQALFGLAILVAMVAVVFF